MVVGGQRGDTQTSGWTWDIVLWSHGVEPGSATWLDVGFGYKVGANEKGASGDLEVMILGPAT